MPNLPEGQVMWLAYLEEVRRVSVVEKGAGGMTFRRGQKPKDPYVVLDAGEQYVVSGDDLHINPRDARIAQVKLAQEHGLEVARVENPVDVDGPGDEEGNAEEEEDDVEEDDGGDEEDDFDDFDDPDEEEDLEEDEDPSDYE